MLKLLLNRRVAVIMSIIAVFSLIGGYNYIKASDPVKLDVKAFANSVEVSWTAPELAVKQDLRYSTSPIDITNFENATVFEAMPEINNGKKQTVKIGGLKENVAYYVAYKYYEVDKAKTEQVKLQNNIISKAVNNKIDAEVSDFNVAGTADQSVNSETAEAKIDIDEKSVTKNVSNVSFANDSEYKVGYAFSSAVTADKDLTAPEQVKNLSFTATNNSITLNWTAPADKDLDGYVVKYNTTDINDATLDKDGTVAKTPVGLPSQAQQVTIDGLTVGKVYYFAVFAKDFSGNLSSMSKITAGTQGAVILQTQSSLNSITFLWQTAVNTTAHEMRMSLQPITEGNYASATLLPNFPGVLAGQNQMYTAGQLVPARTYYFGYRYFVNGSWQLVTLSATTLANDLTAPNTVNNLQLFPQSNSIHMSWKSPIDSDLAGFHIRYATFELNDSNFNNGTIVNNTPIGVPGANQTHEITGLNSDTRYYVGIMAVDTSGNESKVVVANALTTAGNGVSFVAIPNTTSVTLHWITPAGISRHEVKYSTSPITPANYHLASIVTKTPDPIAGNRQTVTVDQLAPNRLYYFVYMYRVGFGNGEVNYAYTSATTLGNDLTAPGPVNTLSLSSTSNSIKADWLSPTDADLAGFHIRYATFELNDTNFNSGVVVNNTPIGIPGANQSMNITGLNSSTKYWVAVVAVDLSGNESPARVNAISTTGTGGGGGGGGGGNGGGGSGGGILYGAFLGPFNLQINGTAAQTFSRNVTLNLTCGSNVRAMAFSNFADLSGAQIMDFRPDYPWTLPEGLGTKTVYARCYGFENQQSPIISDSIELVNGDGNYTGQLPNPTEPNVTPGQVLGVKIKPDNTLVRTPDTKVYLISNGGRKTKIVSLFDLYYRFKGQPIENITFEELSYYPDLNKAVLGTKVFTNGTLVRAEDYRVYVIENGMKKYLPTLEDVRAYGKNKKIQNVTYTDLTQYPSIADNGDRHGNITIKEGSLIRDNAGNVFVVRNGKRQYIPGFAETFERYANVPIINVSTEFVNSIPMSNDLYPHNGKAYIGLGIYDNGTLIRTADYKVLVINDGYGDLVSNEDLRTKYSGRKIIDVNKYFAIPSPKPLYQK